VYFKLKRVGRKVKTRAETGNIWAETSELWAGLGELWAGFATLFGVS
jgi:hypothetical protein